MRDESRLKEFIQGASMLPVLPQVTIRLLNAVDSQNSSTNDLAGIIQAEPTLTVRLLKLANSSFFGQRGKISTVNNAVVVLGSKTIRSLALAVWTHALRLEARNANEMMLMAHLLAHSLITGVTAGMIAERINPDYGEDAFMAGLLHDIGRVALIAQMGSDYRTRILDPAQSEGLPLHEKESVILGFDHRDLGAVLMESWRLPSFLAEVAEKHHDNWIDPSGQFFIASVIMADTLSTRLGYNLTLGRPHPQQDKIASFFGLQSNEVIDEFLILCENRFLTLSEALE